MVDFEPTGPRLSALDFRLLRDLIFDYSGVYLPDSVSYILERRLRPRLNVLGLESFTDYYRYTKYGREGTAELFEILERVTTNETYFFREEYQLRDLLNDVIPRLILQSGKTQDSIKIWSAGCSSGEEPYTISIMLTDAGFVNSKNFDIIANDISRTVLDKANRGLYRRSSFREADEDVIRRYFREEGNRYKISSRIQEQVKFFRGNLVNSEDFTWFEDVDIVFCRNVMIYFSKESREKILNLFMAKMRPGGLLFLGHSETLINMTTNFEFVPLDNCIAYRKPEK
ncbi:MAG: protein-glutamate O-methyltransferase CheR [Myxococcota bacterium]|nr:protein-glutamate O-methyltransferase CheR [Myxococcota bacterium]